MTEIINQIADKWFGWQLSMLWQVGLLIVIVAGLDLLIKKWVWPQVRYALWLLILVKLVLPPSLTSPMSFTAEIPFVVKQTLSNTDLNSGIHKQTIAIKPVELASAEITALPIENVKPIIIATAPAPSITPLSPKSYIFIVWSAGVGILSGWLIIRLSSLRRQHIKNKVSNLPERLDNLLVSTSQKLGLKKTPPVILTNKISCPAVFGLFKPILLMPADKLRNMTTQDAEHIFLHELAHIKRGDLFVHAFYMILQIVYWFNPLLWLIRKHIQNLRELCCDATVAKILREKTVGYRQTLLETARELLAQPVEPGLGLLGLFENSSWLVDRLNWLEKKSWRFRPLRIATVFTLICLMSAFVIPMTKYNPPVDFVIKGIVTDAQTGWPIVNAKVGDVENYAEGKYCTTTDMNGNYSYKTYYEEHGVKAAADGYKQDMKSFGTKIFRREKEKVINFALEPESSSNNVDYASATVEEGIGFDDIIVGSSNCTGEFIKSKFGKPEDEVKNEKTGWWLVYHKKYGLDFWVNLQENILLEIRLNKGFKGKLNSGISMFSSKQDVFAVYGKPVSEIEKSKDDFDKSRTNQILFKKKLGISKIYYEQKGLLFWFYRDNISQIVIYPKMPAKKESSKERMQKLVEDFFKDNYKDIKNRETIEWGEPIIEDNGNQTIRYKYEANIWDSKDRYIFNELFTFNPDGKYISAKKISMILKDYPADNDSSAGQKPAETLKKDYIPRTSTIDEQGRIVDKIDYPFINDAEAIGGWESVDFVRNIEEFKPGIKSWYGDLFLKELYILENGKTNWGYTWTKGLLLHSVSKTASKYIIKNIDGSKYMFLEWKSGDYTIRHEKPSYYVLKQNKDAVFVESRTIDKIDYPFVNDPRVLGKWQSVDFVDKIEQFTPGNRLWPAIDLYLKELVFLPDGKMSVPWYIWTKGLVIHSENQTASKYTIKTLQGNDYMFFEWKSGDYTIRGMKPKYYVLKKET